MGGEVEDVEEEEGEEGEEVEEEGKVEEAAEVVAEKGAWSMGGGLRL